MATGQHGWVEPAPTASGRTPTPQAQEWAVATVRSACRSGRLNLAQAEDRLHAVFAATTMGELYAAIAGLPHPPAPLVLQPGPRP
jgi:hypothetical protein